MTTNEKPASRLRKLLQDPGILVAPGAYDCLTARIIQQAGFPAVYMTGAGTSIAALGYPDLGLATMTEMVGNAAGIVEAVEVPVIADADKAILLDWLVEQFGPESTPFPREYVPRVLTEADYLIDEGAEAILAGTCEACHSLDRVQEARANEEQWRALVLAMIGRGAALPLSDVEPLVEWLARTRGTNPAN